MLKSAKNVVELPLFNEGVNLQSGGDGSHRNPKSSITGDDSNLSETKEQHPPPTFTSSNDDNSIDESAESHKPTENEEEITVFTDNTRQISSDSDSTASIRNHRDHFKEDFGTMSNRPLSPLITSQEATPTVAIVPVVKPTTVVIRPQYTVFASTESRLNITQTEKKTLPSTQNREILDTVTQTVRITAQQTVTPNVEMESSTISSVTTRPHKISSMSIHQNSVSNSIRPQLTVTTSPSTTMNEHGTSTVFVFPSDMSQTDSPNTLGNDSGTRNEKLTDNKDFQKFPEGVGPIFQAPTPIMTPTRIMQGIRSSAIDTETHVQSDDSDLTSVTDEKLNEQQSSMSLTREEAHLLGLTPSTLGVLSSSGNSDIPEHTRLLNDEPGNGEQTVTPDTTKDGGIVPSLEPTANSRLLAENTGIPSL